MEEKTCKTPRRPNWTEKEKIVLVEAVRQREDRLFGKMKGPGGVKNVKIKEGAWEEVAGAVNANSDTTQRTVDEIKKQYANIKQRAKEKSDAIRRPVTGGGPKPPSPTPVEAELLSHLEDRPTLCGLSTGHDTEEGSYWIYCLNI
ncbi:myb/SANT-like DNA-binding domain-containing protein 4 [Saccostrea cucullata]|uniref:myb/SANT-like DNA-binding domain-containing protein 4 n=1 Tax=Saccostrea cuccullata TaxID=36930 RepID=UPI002ED40555